tara:strand:+ start:395 stop:1045 length:651 start_codon:yes stop_codon:yes gene_type:complete
MKKIVVLISGSGTNLESIINCCNSKNINGEVVCVISNNPDAYGLKRAKKLNVESKVIDHTKFCSRVDFEHELENYLNELQPDLIVLAGFMRILGQKIIKQFSDKMINLHPSLLPLYPGLNTHQKALNNGDEEHGISIHFVSSELDAGPLIAQGVIKIKKDEFIDSLIERIHKVEHILLPKIINDICNGNVYLENNKVKFVGMNLKNNKMYLKKYEF